MELAHATYSALPSGESTISVGCSAVGHVATTAFFSRSMTPTAARFHRLTNARLPSGDSTQTYGNAPISFFGAASSSAVFAFGSLRPSGGLGGSPFPAPFFAGSAALVVAMYTLLSGLSSGTRTTQSPHGDATNSSFPPLSAVRPPTTTRCLSLSARLTSIGRPFVRNPLSKSNTWTVSNSPPLANTCLPSGEKHRP